MAHRVHRFDITKGPSKLDFMLAVFDGDRDYRREVTFFLEDPQRKPEDPLIPSLPFVLNGVSREDGNDENWLFKGYYPGSAGNCPAHGSFSTHTRKGWVEF